MITLKETATRILITGPESETELISEHFKFQPPDYWRSPAYQKFVASRQEWIEAGSNENERWKIRGWNGWKYPAKRQKDGSLELGRGHRDELLSLLDREEININREKLLDSPFHGLTTDDLPDDLLPGSEFELDYGQRQCVVALLSSAIGCIRVTVSGGKTAIFFAAASMIRRRHPKARILYLVPSERLVKQVTVEGKKFLPDWDITQFGGSKKDNTGTDVVVATVATLKARYKELLFSGWFRSFTVLLVDEAHHLASGKTWQDVTLVVPAFYRFGASDGLKNERKEDVTLDIALRGFIGPERFVIGLEPLLILDRVAKPYIYLVDDPTWAKKFDHLPHTAEPGSEAWTLIDGVWTRGTYVCPASDLDEDGDDVKRLGWQRLLIEGEELEVESRWCLLKRAHDEGIIRFKERNDRIVAWTKHFVDRGHPTLVIATRTTHIYILTALMERAGLAPRVLTGLSSSKERDETFEWLTSTPGAILISPIVKEGVSLPELRAGVVADPVASPDLARQIIGRFIRKKPTGDNHAEVVFFIDRQYKSARLNSMHLIHELETVRGYDFFYPCLGPDVIGERYAAIDVLAATTTGPRKREFSS